MIVQGFDVFKTYLAFKQHFSNPKFDFFQYDGKVRAKEETYHDRKDFYFFETLARKHTDREIKERFLSVFVYSDHPEKVWIGEVKQKGDQLSTEYNKRWESMTYLFTRDFKTCLTFCDNNLNKLLSTTEGHPQLLKLHIKGKVMLETLVILDIVCGFQKDWDKKLTDPLWEKLSYKIGKYKPFVSVDSKKYKRLILDLL